MDKKIKDEFFRTIKITSGKNDIVRDKVCIDSYRAYHGLKQPSLDACVAGATDFAQILGADVQPKRQQPSTGQPCGDIVLRSTIGHLDNYVDSVIAGTANQGSKMVNDSTGLICPVIFANDSVLEPNSPFGEYKVKKAGSYYTIAFNRLVWPQKLAGNQSELNTARVIGALTPTGKSFSGRMVFDHTLDPLPEYEYRGRKYVHVEATKDEVLESGAYIQRGQKYWVEVLPIVWQVRNHTNLPQINPFATGKEEHLELRSESGIISGIPFYPEYIGTYSNEWQNSLIRAYLNGIDIYDEIKRKNGLSKKKMPDNFNFTKSGFLDQIYEEEQVAQVTKPRTQTTAKPRTYGYGVKISSDKAKIDDQIKFYVKNGQSFMLHGPSGVGKSRRVQEIDPNYVMIQLREGILPEEIMGKTAYENDKSVWLPPTWYTAICDVCAKDPNKNHILFIDEITNVRPHEQGLVYHIVLERSVDGSDDKLLPDNCVVVAAGNSIFESDAAHNMPEPLFRRFNGHINIPLSVDEFLNWGCQLNEEGRPKVHPIVLAYVASHHELLYSKYDSEKPPEYAIDPRGWEQISDIIYDNDEVVRLSLIENKIGHENAVDFCNFAKTPLITIDEIMNDDIDTRRVPSDFNAQHVLCLTLRCATEEQVPKVRKFIRKYLGGEHLAYFDSVWTEDNDERALLIGRLSDTGAIYTE